MLSKPHFFFGLKLESKIRKTSGLCSVMAAGLCCIFQAPLQLRVSIFCGDNHQKKVEEDGLDIRNEDWYILISARTLLCSW